MLGKIEGRRRRRRQDQMVRWHHRFNGYELGQKKKDGEPGELQSTVMKSWT